MQTDIYWSSVFKRNLTFIGDLRLREINFKLLYNLLPVRNNLFKWGIADDKYCPHCHVIEDVVHAFVECDLNKRFFIYVKRVVMYTFNVDIHVNTYCLLKINNDKNTDITMTVAFWCIYKMLLIRNRYGLDRRALNLRYLFEREITNRIFTNNEMKKPDKRLPDKMLYVL